VSLEKKIETEAQTWLLRVMSDDMSEDEQQEFNYWFNKNIAHQTAYNKAHEVWAKLNFLEDTLLTDFEKTPNLSHHQPNKLFSKSKNKAPIYQNPLFKQAAVFLVCFICLNFYYKDEIIVTLTADMITVQGEQNTKLLSDGTKLTLNTDSAVRINYSTNRRHIKLLKGEIYLEAKSNPKRPLIIETNQGSAKAIGTAFAVRKTKKAMIVTVTEGSVVVKKSGNAVTNEETLLRLNQSISLGKNIPTRKVHQVNAVKSLAWRSGKIIFKDKPINQALNELDRYFPGKIIQLTSLNESVKINGVFQKDKIRDAIKAIASTQNKTVSFTPGNYLAIIN